MRNGSAWEHTTSEPPTSETGSSSSPGLPTPRAREWKAGGKDGLEELLLFKTPTSQLAVNGGSQHPDKRKAGGHGPTLADEVEHLLPTPAASNPNDGEDLQSWEARRQRNKAKGINGNGQGTPLSIAVRLLPTPTAQAHSRNSTANRTDPKPTTNTKSSTLLDVFWTGAPTDPPSPDGSE
jgi:hypothetical protein